MTYFRNIVVVLSLLTATPVSAATYYIDYVGGADTNNGTAKVTPFKHAPGMFVCTNTCASTTPAAGDNFIFKGGVTWPNASLGWNWAWSGNATTASPGCTGSGCIYIGVDQTWYTGGSWTRPILNGEGSAVGTPTDGVANVLLRLYANYVIIDNFEMKGLFWTGTPSYGTGVHIALAGGTPGVGTNVEIKNNYLHGWTHGAGGTTENPCGIIGDTGIPNNNVNTYAHNNVIDGSDTDQQSCSAFFGGPPYIAYNYMQWVTSCAIINGTIVFSSNTCLHVPASFDAGAHTNGLEINASQNVVVSNNVIAHLGSGTLALWCAPYPTYTCTIYNNLIYNTDVGNVIDIAPAVYTAGNCTLGTPPYCTVSGTTNLYNNTIECGQDSGPAAVCVAGIASTTTAVALKNNHFITNATSPNGGVWSTNGPTPTETTNLLQSLATANSAGYTSAQGWPFSPATGSATTVNAGTDLTSTCGSFAGLCLDTALGVTLNTNNYTVVTPGRTQLAHPSGSAWDIGAYEFSSTTVTGGVGSFLGGRRD